MNSESNNTVNRIIREVVTRQWQKESFDKPRKFTISKMVNVHGHSEPYKIVILGQKDLTLAAPSENFSKGDTVLVDGHPMRVRATSNNLITLRPINTRPHKILEDK